MNFLYQITIVMLLSISMHAAVAQPLVQDFAQLVQGGKKAIDVFNKAKSSPIPLVIKCSMAGCMPCVQTAPGFHKMAEDYKGLATFITVDVIKFEELAKHKDFNIQSVPTFLVFAENQKLGEVRSSKKMETLRVILNKYLQSKKK